MIRPTATRLAFAPKPRIEAVTACAAKVIECDCSASSARLRILAAFFGLARTAACICRIVGASPGFSSGGGGIFDSWTVVELLVCARTHGTISVIPSTKMVIDREKG